LKTFCRQASARSPGVSSRQSLCHRPEQIPVQSRRYISMSSSTSGTPKHQWKIITPYRVFRMDFHWFSDFRRSHSWFASESRMAAPPVARGSCCSLGFYFQKGPFLRI
jgi:hypothetical protein